MKSYKQFCKDANIIEDLNLVAKSTKPKPSKEPSKEVLAYKNYQPGVLDKSTGKFTQRAHSDTEQNRYGWKPVKASVYAPGDAFTPNAVTATGDPHNWKTRNAAVPFKYKEGQAPKGQSGAPSIPYGSTLRVTAEPQGTKTKETKAKINDVGDFGKTGNVNKDTSFDLSPQITKDIAGTNITPQKWGKRMVYTQVSSPSNAKTAPAPKK
jgi:hypothetical protein